MSLTNSTILHLHFLPKTSKLTKKIYYLIMYLLLVSPLEYKPTKLWTVFILYPKIGNSACILLRSNTYF